MSEGLPEQRLHGSPCSFSHSLFGAEGIPSSVITRVKMLRKAITLDTTGVQMAT